MKISELKIYRLNDYPEVLKFFENKVACGVPTNVGDPTGEDFNLLTHYGMEPSTTIIVEAQGDSMKPDIKNGDLIFIDTKQQPQNGDLIFIDTKQQPQNGDTVLAFIDDEALIKEIYYDKETRKVKLIPLNKKFDVIEISSRSKRLKIQGVVKFVVHSVRQNTLKVVKGKGKKKKDTAPSEPIPASKAILSPEGEKEGAMKEEKASKNDLALDKLMQGRKGKKAALAIYCAAKQGLITETDYNSVADRFGDIGSRSGYNRYMGNPQRFTDLEIESTTNFIQSLITPKEGKAD